MIEVPIFEEFLLRLGALSWRSFTQIEDLMTVGPPANGQAVNVLDKVSEFRIWQT